MSECHLRKFSQKASELHTLYLRIFLNQGPVSYTCRLKYLDFLGPESKSISPRQTHVNSPTELVMRLLYKLQYNITHTHTRIVIDIDMQIYSVI